jgi:beta-N-acetylhexosaminidase
MVVRKVLVLLALLGLVFLAASCGDDSSSSDSDQTGDDLANGGIFGDDDDNDGTPSEDPFCEIDEARVEQLFDKMTLRRKIAQMYLIGAPVLPWFEHEDTKRFVQEVGVGAVGIQPGTGIGFWPEWTVQNTNKLQKWAMDSDPAIPLFIGCDQEGGVPQAINSITGGTDQPGNLGLGATFDPAATYSSYGIMGEQLSALGINHSYGPVVEVSVTYKEVPMYMRSFGEDTAAAALHSEQAVLGFKDNMVLATAKHFPGQGTASGDDHAGRIVNYESEAIIRERYFPPFKAAIDAGVDMIMTNHVVFAEIDDGVPTTFSRKMTTEILRGELGFEGLILTDDMNMGAIMGVPLDQHPDVLAIMAGADLVLDAGGDGEPSFDWHPDNLKWAWDVQGQIDAVIGAVDDGLIDEEQIDDSVRRILRTKMKYCLFENQQRKPSESAAVLDTPDQVETSKGIFEQAITLVKNDGSLVPLDPNAGLKLHVVSIAMLQSEMYPDAFWGNVSSTSLLLEIKKLYPAATGDHFDITPFGFTIDRLVKNTITNDPDVLIVSTFNGYHYQSQRDLVDALMALGIPTILVATATPYDLMAFLDVDAYLALYSNRGMALTVAAEIIFGLREPLGRLPVTLSEEYKLGYSAY